MACLVTIIHANLGWGKITMSDQTKACPMCKGTGEHHSNPTYECDMCQGKGIIPNVAICRYCEQELDFNALLLHAYGACIKKES